MNKNNFDTPTKPEISPALTKWKPGVVHNIQTTRHIPIPVEGWHTPGEILMDYKFPFERGRK